MVQHQQYDSYSGSVTVVQPLFDYDAYAGYRIGIIKKMQSDERYRNSLIDLQNRFITAGWILPRRINGSSLRLCIVRGWKSRKSRLSDSLRPVREQ